VTGDQGHARLAALVAVLRTSVRPARWCGGGERLRLSSAPVTGRVAELDEIPQQMSSDAYRVRKGILAGLGNHSLRDRGVL
jgi:hypothetical protein